MAIIKCKMCGGDVELAADKTFGSCEFCGSTMTFPKVDDDQRAAAFNRGNHFRRIGEFDKALAVYERIVREDDTDAEAHWCCALCRFGIEYVEDPATFEWLPTCHRASFDSFLEDVDYLAALEHSDGITRRQYQKDGAKIAEVQRGILATSQNTEPYDVFICYKESDENGGRTRDSLMAQDIYYQLTEQGRKVFFARITLEDVVGTQYEPYIFAALNSAKVMIVVGTKPEYLNAVWVKNEWSRFLAMMKKDRHKLLLPCYRDMDPYDLPEQLSVLQSYDMAKIGFIQDLTRGIAKVLDADKKPEKVTETVVVQQAAAPAANTAPLLERAFMFLEDGDWSSANEYCEKVLDNDPENARAYLGKLMAELQVKRQENLKDCAQPFDGKNNYQKAIRFGDEKLKADLEGYTHHIKERNENERLESIYSKAKAAMNKAATESEFVEAMNVFGNICGYKDAGILEVRCREMAKEEKDKRQALLQEYMVAVQMPSLEAQHKTLSDIKCAWNEIEKEFVLLETQKQTIQGELTKLSNEISNLGFFAGRRKKEIAQTLEALEIEQGSVSNQMKTLQNKKQGYQSFSDVCAAIENIEAQISAQKKRLKGTYGAKSSKAIREELSKLALEPSDLAECDYIDATQLSNEGKNALAAVMFGAIGDYKDAKAQSFALWHKIAVRETISAGVNHTVGLRADGTVVAVGANYSGQCNVSGWKDIVAISAGDDHTVGLRADGTVVAVGDNDHGQCDVSGWKDIVAISAGDDHTVGLRADGTVVVTKYTGKSKYYHGQCDVSGWKDIVAISAGWLHTVGLRADGTVVAVGEKTNGQCEVSGWKDIVAISAGAYHTVGLHADGTVATTQYTGDNKVFRGPCNVSGWKDMVAISAGFYHTVGLRVDGTVVVTKYTGKSKYYHGQCDVSGWKDIVAISARRVHTVGLRADGTVVATNLAQDAWYNYGQCNVSGWKDIVAISAGADHTVGVHADGTVATTQYTGDSKVFRGPCNVSGWTNIKAPE